MPPLVDTSTKLPLVTVVELSINRPIRCGASPLKSCAGTKRMRASALSSSAWLSDTPSIAGALSALATLAAVARDSVEALHIDLADLRGYHYQNGVSFSVFTAGEPNAIGRGERYDGIGKAFGRARPATGFTLDLRQIAALGNRSA